jgi:GT2 family glycosyltransferase
MTFRSLPSLSRKPDEILVIMDGDEEKVEERTLAGVPVRVIHTRQRGAAAKRNLGVEKSSGEAILFVDDDVEFRADTVNALERCLAKNNQIGGVSSFIENQGFREPGNYSRWIYKLSGGMGIKDYSGKCFGPLINIYPRPWSHGPEFAECDWLNAGCTLYLRTALPSPSFEANFTGYSFMEDLALSRRVRKKWKIGMARDARYFHHSRPASYKNNSGRLQQMGLENKHHILREVEGWSAVRAAFGLTWLEILLLPAKLRQMLTQTNGFAAVAGTVRGLVKIWGKSV